MGKQTKEYKRKWRVCNPSADKKYREANKEKESARGKKWRNANALKVKLYSAAASARGMDFILACKAWPCTDCGGCFPPECMDFDHVRGVKVMNVSHMKAHPVASIKAEIEKCELVCANCHRTRTKTRCKVFK